MSKPGKTQVEKFRAVARELEADESEDAFNAALKAVATGKGVDKALGRLADELGQNGPKPKRR